MEVGWAHGAGSHALGGDAVIPKVDRLVRSAPLERTVVAVVAIVSLVVIAWLDHVIDVSVGVAVFYIVPVAIISWQASQRVALLVAVLATLTWTLADLTPAGFSEVGVSILAVASRLVIFAGIAILVSTLRDDRDELRSTLTTVVRARREQASLLASLRDPLLIVSRDGVVTDQNAATLALLGPAAGVAGRRIVELLPFVDPPRAGSPNAHWNGTLSDVTGRTVVVEVTATPVVASTNDRLSVYVVHDVSQHAEVLRLREQLLYDVAHELRGPLGVLEGALEILAGDYGDLPVEDFSRLTGSARRTAGRLRTLMEDLLSAGSIQAGRFQVAPTATPLAAIVGEAADAVAPTLAEREQQLELRVPDLAVEADARYIRQVLTNLILNASKYGPPGGQILVSAVVAAGGVRVSVEDRGPGIPPERQVGLFERYYRVRPSGGDDSGIGLGLAIAKGIVEAHGGRIGVDSEPGRGTTVWFTLRLAHTGAAT